MRVPALLAALCLACGREQTPAAESAAPAVTEQPSTWFTDVTGAWGLDFVHDAGLTPEKHLPETMGAGAALVDVDEDGDLDLYLVQGGPMRLGGDGPGTFRAPPGPLPTNRLYRNAGDGRLEDATGSSGDAAHDGYGMAVAAGDADGDGHTDLFVTNLGPDALFAGDGAGGFRDRTDAAGLGDPRWTSAATFFDAEGDGDLDLYVCAYLEVDLSAPQWCGGREPGWRSACHPDEYDGLTDRLWVNDGSGRFRDGTAAAGLSASAGKALGVHASDLDGDGDLDVYTANDSVENRLWENLGGGRFRDATLISGTGVDERGATEAGMGLAVGDVDGDLDPDLFVTNFDEESNTLYLNEGGGLFRDRTVASGLDAPSRMPVGFGVVLADFDHDADLDLAVANGHIIDNIHLYHDGKTHAQRAQLFENDGLGRFAAVEVERTRGLGARALVGRGLYAGDLDGDGDLDLLLTQCGGAARLFRNDRARGAALRVEGLPAGTWLVLERADGTSLLREAGAGTSYFGQSAPGVPFGVPPGEVAALVLRPPYADERTLRVGEELPDPLPAVLTLAPDGDGGWRVP